MNKRPINHSKKPEKMIREIQLHDLGLLLNTPFSINQLYSNFLVPNWLENKEKKDVSFIVPIINQNVEKFIHNWELDLNFSYEIIFVDDNSPNQAKIAVLKEFQKIKERIKSPFVKILYSEYSQGWGACCNAGAECAKSKNLIFVDPNGSVMPGSYNNLFNYFSNDRIGVVGGVIINELDDNIIELGRKYKDGKFLKIGSEIYKNKNIINPIDLSDLDDDFFSAHEVESINTSIACIKKTTFEKIGGFCPNLFNKKISENDLCLRLKENSFKIVCDTNIKFFTETKKEDKIFYKNSEAVFYNKWISTNRINSIIPDLIYKETDNKRILVKRCAANGDVLVASSVCSIIKNKYKNCHITFSTDCPDVLKNNVHVSNIVSSEFSERYFDIFYNLDMAYEYKPKSNILECYMEHCGFFEEKPEFFIDTEIFDIPDDYIVFHSGKTSWAGRNWSQVKFDQLAYKLRKRDFKVVCIGTDSDNKVNCDIDLRGKTNIQQMAYIIKNCKVFVGIDSFPMHVAQFVNCPGVVFFGSVDPKTRIFRENMIPVRSETLECIGCHHLNSIPCTSTIICKMQTQNCINDVTVSMMLTQIEKILNT